MTVRRIYYQFKPYLPWRLRMTGRRLAARWRRKVYNNVWPINEVAGKSPAGWPGWPAGKQFALVLTHDVEGPEGLAKCRKLMQLEKELGFRSSFNFVPESGYLVPRDLREELMQNGFEVGLHDLRHDGKLYQSRPVFAENARRINHYVKEWGASGFRSGFMLHQMEWLHDLEIDYDTSTFDTDPFEPQPDGVHTIFPFWVPRPMPENCEGDGPRSVASPERGYMELPYTLPQDSTLFLVLRESTPEIWLRKLDWIVQRGGMALVNVHPDYLQFPGEPATPSTYPVAHYLEFLARVRERYDGCHWQPLPREMAAYCAKFHPPKPADSGRRIAMIAYSVYRRDNRVIRYAESLASRGDTVDVMALKEDPSLPAQIKIGGVNVYNCQGRYAKNEQSHGDFLLPLLRFWAVANLSLAWRHFRQRYDVIHVHNMPDFLVFAAWFPRLTGAKVILDIHDIMPEFYASKFKKSADSSGIKVLKWMESISARFAHHVIISNHLWLNPFVSRSAPARKCSVFINHVNQQLFYPRPHAGNGDKRIIMFPGGLQWHQGLDIAIRAMPSVLRKIPNAEFHIYGDGNKKEELVQLTRDLGLVEKVRFFEPRTLNEIAGVMAQADLGVVPKRADSFGNEAYSTKIMEFMSLGVPMVVSSTKIDRYYFNDSLVRFFESGNAESLAEGIVEILQNDERRQRMIADALDYADQNSWQRRQTYYFDLVDALIENRPVRSIRAPIQVPVGIVPSAKEMGTMVVDKAIPVHRNSQMATRAGAGFRPDRLISLNLVQPCLRVTTQLRSLTTRKAPSDRCLPVLMYHGISDDPVAGVSAYYRTTTRPEVFARQMAWLKAEGFQGVDLSTGLDWLESPRNGSNARLVAITFDDGFRNFFTEAFPVLREAGFTATMYIPTAFMGEPAARRSFKGQECLAWNEIRELKSAGMEFGSHTINHPRLVDLAWEQVQAELADSKSEIEQQLGCAVATFAYPYAFPQGDKDFVRRFCDLAAATGYRSCVTTEIGRVKPGNDPYRLKRLPINSWDDEALFRVKLEGGYDWLALPQGFTKKFKWRSNGLPRANPTPAGHPTTEGMHASNKCMDVLRGRRAAVVLFSDYPGDPRPCRAAEALAQEGMLVDIICLQAHQEEPKREMVNGVSVFRLPFRRRRGGKLEYLFQYSAFTLAALTILAVRSCQRRYDLVHVHNMPDFLVLSATIPKLLGAKVILDLHDPMPELMITIFKLPAESFFVHALKRTEKLSIRCADLVLTPNLAFKDIFTSRSCPPDKMQIIMNSPEEEIFKFKPVSAELPLRDPSRPFVILHHGFLAARHGLDLAIDALQIVRKSIPTAVIVICGENTPYLENIMESLSKRGLQHTIRYLGMRSHPQIVEAIEQCDVGIIPNRRSIFTEINMPTRIFEYLALGKPVIAPATRGIQDYFTAEDIIFFEPDNVADLARKIESVAFQPREVRETIRRGQAVYQKHLWHKQRSEFLRLVRGLLGEDSTRQIAKSVAVTESKLRTGNHQIPLSAERDSSPANSKQPNDSIPECKTSDC